MSAPMDDVPEVDCWACGEDIPHVHRRGQECPHRPSTGGPRSCCADWDRGRVALLKLTMGIKDGTQQIPDSRAELEGA